MRKSTLTVAMLFAVAAYSVASAQQDPNPSTTKFLQDAANPYVATGGKVPPAPPGMAAPAPAPAKAAKRSKKKKKM